MSEWMDFNSAQDSGAFTLIPKGTLIKVRMTIKPGGHDDPQMGWTGGWATHNPTKGSMYLSCEFVVLEGEFAKRKLWSLIGLHSPKGDTWAGLGRSFVKGVLNSAYGLMPDDVSAPAQAKRRIRDFGDLDGIVFVAQVSWEKDEYGEDKSVIKAPVTPDHPKYALVMRGGGGTAHAPTSGAAPANRASSAPVPSRPSWAQ